MTIEDRIRRAIASLKTQVRSLRSGVLHTYQPIPDSMWDKADRVTDSARGELDHGDEGLMIFFVGAKMRVMRYAWDADAKVRRLVWYEDMARDLAMRENESN